MRGSRGGPDALPGRTRTRPELLIEEHDHAIHSLLPAILRQHRVALPVEVDREESIPELTLERVPSRSDGTVAPVSQPEHLRRRSPDRLEVAGATLTVVTPRSPLGRALVGLREGDEAELVTAQGPRQSFVVAIA